MSVQIGVNMMIRALCCDNTTMCTIFLYHYSTIFGLLVWCVYVHNACDVTCCCYEEDYSTPLQQHIWVLRVCDTSWRYACVVLCMYSMLHCVMMLRILCDDGVTNTRWSGWKWFLNESGNLVKRCYLCILGYSVDLMKWSSMCYCVI